MVVRKTLVLSLCLLTLLGAPATYGEPFGALRAWHVPSSQLKAGGLLADPVLAHWLSRLPETDTEPTAAPAAMSTEFLKAQPIGGEVFSLMTTAPPSNASRPIAEAGVDRQLFDAMPLGGEPGRFVSAGTQPLIIATNSEPPRATEGRSASRTHHARKHRHQRAKVVVGRSAASRCTCASTGPLVSERPISN